MIISFYSYKGGVGRSQLCANVASYLCNCRGQKVLLWDWDFEAPGLHYFFGRSHQDINSKGTIEVLQAYSQMMRTQSVVSESDYKFLDSEFFIPIKPSTSESTGRIDLIPAGNYNDSYVLKVNTFDWYEFYELLDGQTYIEAVKKWLKSLDYDFIFIDSRTGITDYSGICNIQLPDTNVVVMAANEQNVTGCKRVIEQILNSEYTKRGFRESYILPILSRINVNYTTIINKWSNRFVDDFGGLLKGIDHTIEDVFVKDVFKDFYLDKTILEDDPLFSAGENLLITESTQIDDINKGSLSSKFANISEYLINLKSEKNIGLYSQVDLDTWLKYAEQAIRTNENKKASLAYSKAQKWDKSIELGGTVDAFYNKANEYFLRGDFHQAMSLYQEALKINPKLQEAATKIDEIQDRILIAEKLAFFEKYKTFAEIKTLEVIWHTKTTQSVELIINDFKISDLILLRGLKNLQILDISSPFLADLSPLKDLANLQQLNVSSTQVSDLSPLKDLANLQQLNVSSTQVSDLSPLKDLANLQQLNVSSTQVSDLSPLKDLANLQQLNVSSTQVSDLSPLKDLANLQQLYVSSTQVSDLSPLKDLANLQQLNVSSTQVSDLSPLKDLANLQQLYVHRTQISDLTSLTRLSNLQQISVSETQVSDLSPLKDLVNLQQFSINSSQVSDLSPLKDLANLQQLYVSSSQVSDLSPLKDLANLQQLNVSSSQVSDLSPLKDLANLQQISVSETQVSDLSPLKDLANLQQLNVSLSQVSDLSPLKGIIEQGVEVKWSDELWEGKGIYVRGCPLNKLLITAIKKGHKEVLNYFIKPKQRLFEARVLILGEPRAGKTTLRRKLKSVSAPMPTNAESTKAFEIEIEPYTCVHEQDGERNKLTYHLWDFGGQDYYRLLHQLFVAEQSVYIIVTDTDRNKNEEEIDFWLETIQRLGKDKNGNYGPVILFQNPKTYREGSDFVDLKKRYRFWKQNEQFVINLNALDEKNTEWYDKKQFDRFKQFKTYLEESFYQLDHISKEIPTQWINVRKGLVKYEKEDWISVEQFNKVCASKHITDAQEQEDLLDIFHTLGYVLHYKDTALRGMVILNREWVTDALYRVLDDEIVKTNRGWFKKEDADKIWHEARYKNRMHELLALMSEFKLSYYNPASQKYIVPAKLPEDTEGLPTWEAEHPVRLHLQYDWMPRAVPTQLIVSLHNDIVTLDNGEQWIWRKGAVLDGRHLGLKDVQVQIEDNWRENKIEIIAKGARSELLIRTIMRNWREVNQPFEDKVTVSKIILCACEKCQSARTPFEFEYEDVLEAKEANDTMRCNKSRKEFTAADILRGLFDETMQLTDLALSKGVHSELLDFIADGQIEKAFDALPNTGDIALLKSRYQDLTKANSIGVLSFEEYKRETAKITKSLIDYLSSSRKEGFGKGHRGLFLGEE